MYGSSSASVPPSFWMSSVVSCSCTSSMSSTVMMPSSRPSVSTSAPPELPGLIAASVWMKFSKVLMPS